jgi:signal transduction histidine kinase
MSGRPRLAPLALAALIALAGAAGSVAIGAVMGMSGHELVNLSLSLLPALLLSLAAAALAARLLAHAPARRRLLGVIVIASLVGIANLFVLSVTMWIDGSQALDLGVLLLYTTAVGAGTALALTGEAVDAVERLTETARRLGDGDLDARAGPIDAGPELRSLAMTLDDMAVRLRDSIERERDLEAGRRDLIAAASHDLRTPIASLRVMLEAIEDGVVSDSDEQRRYMHEMRNSVDALVALTDDLFELVQLEAGAIEADAERSTLELVTNAALAACEGQALEKGVAVRAELGTAATTSCSPRLGRVIQNLVQNAIRHTPPGGSVRVEADRSAARVSLVVTDTGEGIPPDSIDRVFEPFWRGDAARGSGAGSGLGLTLAKRIVEGLGGEIAVETERPIGARFAVTVPVG